MLASLLDRVKAKIILGLISIKHPYLRGRGKKTPSAPLRLLRA